MFKDPSGLSGEGAKTGIGDPPAGWTPYSYDGSENITDKPKDAVSGAGTGENPVGASASSWTIEERVQHVQDFNTTWGEDLERTRQSVGNGMPGGGELFTGRGTGGNGGGNGIPNSGPNIAAGKGNDKVSNPSHDLPSYQQMYDNYPKDKNGEDLEAKKIYELVGGDVYDLHKQNPKRYANACALRISIALIKSGINIPKSKMTSTGADGNNYYLSAVELKKWLTSYFYDSPPLEISDDFDNQLQGNKGIYIMIPNYPGSRGFGASGHATLFTGTDCISSHCYLNATGGVYRVYLWSLQ